MKSKKNLLATFCVFVAAAVFLTLLYVCGNSLSDLLFSASFGASNSFTEGTIVGDGVCSDTPTDDKMTGMGGSENHVFVDATDRLWVCPPNADGNRIKFFIAIEEVLD